MSPISRKLRVIVMTGQFRVIRALLPFLGGYRWALAVIIVLGVLSSLAEGVGISLFIPFLETLNQHASETDSENMLVDTLNRFASLIPVESRLLVISATIFGCILLKGVLNYSNGILFNWVNSRIGHQLRSDIFKQLLTVGYGFLQRKDSGVLLNTLSTESWHMVEALEVVVSLITTLCTMVVYALLLLFISWKMTLVVAMVMWLISMIINVMVRRARRLGLMATRANAVLGSRMLEGLEGMKTIRTFGREDHEQQRHDQASERVTKVSLKLGLLEGAIGPIYEILAAALLVTLLYFTLSVSQNVTSLLVFIFALYRLQPQVMALDEGRVALASLVGAVEDVTTLLKRADKPYIVSGTKTCPKPQEGFRFEHVTFHYNPPDPAALDDVSLTIPAGKTTALVGPSGAGKSTLINLVFRFYDPTSGRIYIDDLPLIELDLASWRDRIALVSQDFFIFNTTIRDNIAFGRLEATDDEISAAAKLANAHDFIMQLPQGYKTRVGDRGVRLSGGQQQRITLARAIVRDPQILILDEATNSLDSISEHIVQEALQKLREDRTVIVIAHRFSTVQHADHIIVLDQGRVCEQGSMQQLLNHTGLFAKLYHLHRRTASYYGS